MTTRAAINFRQRCHATNTGSWCQESWDTSSRQAGRRARQLRKAGYSVSCSPMGPQITPVGRVVLTLITIRPGSNEDTFALPQ